MIGLLAALVAASIVACYAVVVALSLAMDRAVFRPLRGESPAVMLVTTFAIAFVLQAVALLIDIRDDTIGEIASSIASFNQAITVAGVDVRKITIAAMVIAVVVLALLAVLLTRTTIGLHMRAAASDIGTARLLGVQADRVIGFAVLLSGLVAATVAVILTVQNPFVGPEFALRETIVVLVGVVGIASSFVSGANEIYFLDALVSVAIVVAIYVFIGNSGVLSFGQISFVAVGAFIAGVMTVPLDSKAGVLPQLFPVLRDHTIGNVPSLLLATATGGVFAFLVGLPLMRLSGLAAGIATLAVLEITHNLLRATREDAAAARGVGVNVHAQRLWAFTLSGALAAFSGALLVHELGSITTEQVYLELTFVTLAMLVVGGVSSLWGAVLGALVVSGVNSFLTEAEQGVDVGLTLDLPSGTRLILLGSLMALVLILRPAGLTGGRELRLSPPNIGSATRRRLSPRGD